MGFSIPVHAADRPIPASPSVVTLDAEGNATEHTKLKVVADVDAYARATLKDEQPGLLVKTVLRAVGKQVAVNIAAREAKKQAEAHGGQLAGLGASVLVGFGGSSAMTLTEVADTRPLSSPTPSARHSSTYLKAFTRSKCTRVPIA